MTENSSPLTLVLADDHGIVREGVAAFCRSRPDITVVAECSDGRSALEAILAHRPDFAILDLQMPHLSGLDVLKRSREAQAGTRIIILSINRDETVIKELFRNGVSGYVLKDGPGRHLFDAMNYALDGGQYLTPLLSREVLENKSDASDKLSFLSKREYEVFTYLVDGMRPRDIATLLTISPKTVDTYRANIMRKLEVNGIAELVRYAIQRNLNVTSPPC